MTARFDGFLRSQLAERKDRLERGMLRQTQGTKGTNGSLQSLLDEVDSALARLEDGSYGICESCHDTIEYDRLISDPLTRFCLDHLSPKEKNALEQDLQLAARVQGGLLPVRDLDRDGWQIRYWYDPAGVVSGDYCDIIDAGVDGTYFVVGDVSGKGVAASMLMSHLHAMFRALISVGFSLQRLVEQVSRSFCESTLPNQYATLICGRALPDGQVEIANAGHPYPLISHHEDVWPLETSNVPIGLFSNAEFSVSRLQLNQGQHLVIFSDGVSEATDTLGGEYGTERLKDLIGRNRQHSAPDLLAACRDDLTAFRFGAPKNDDVTLFVISRSPASE